MHKSGVKTACGFHSPPKSVIWRWLQGMGTPKWPHTHSTYIQKSFLERLHYCMPKLYTGWKTFSHLFVSGFKISLNSNILVFGLFRIAAKKVRFLGDLEPICVFSPHPHGCNMLFIFRSLQKWRYKSIEKHPITKRIMRRNWAGWRWMNCQEIFFFHQSFWNPSLFSVYQNWYPDDWLVDMTWLFSVNF